MGYPAKLLPIQSKQNHVSEPSTRHMFVLEPVSMLQLNTVRILMFLLIPDYNSMTNKIVHPY